MSLDKYRELVLERIRKGHLTDDARVPGCSTKALTTKTLQKQSGAEDAITLEDELAVMRNEGIIACTNGIWWAR